VRGGAAPLWPFIDLAAVADVKEMNASGGGIKLVEDAIIPGTQLEFGASSQPLVRKSRQAASPFVNLGRDRFS